ncbi:MAG: polar amino acid transport system substrate-binding protein, partial [Halieaceae bacterium]
MFKPVHALTSLLMAVLLLVAPTLQAGDTLDRVVNNKTLVVGMSADQPPMNALNRQGKFMGFDVDLAKAIANAMRVELKIEKVPFGDLTGALEAGKIDMVISGMAITPERSRKAAFIGPYMMSGKSILASADAIVDFQSGGLAASDVKLAALRNSTSATFVRESAPNATLVEVDDYASAIEMVRNGDVAGMVADAPTCALAVLRNPDAGLVTLEKPLTIEPFGIAVNANDPQFLNLVQNYVRTYEGIGLLTQLRKK